MPEKQIDLNPVIANILRYGVTISTLLIVVGILLTAAEDASGGSALTLGQVIRMDYGRPTLDFNALLLGVVHLNGVYVVQLGLLVLLATPVVRVAASILLFLAENDWKYVVITFVVLGILLFSIFVVGPYEAHNGAAGAVLTLRIAVRPE